MAETTKSYTAAEVSKHNKRDDLWIIIDNKIYDVTHFDDHPGTMEAFIDNAGKDATSDFENQGHSKTAKNLMKNYLVGELKEEKAEDAGPQKRSGQSGATKRIITEEELRKHCILGDCWLLIEGNVYDVSKYTHPGGRQIHVDNSGRDCTREFLDIGHKNADKVLPNLLIGEIEEKEKRNYTPVAEEVKESPPYLQYAIIAIAALVLMKIMGII